MNSWLPSDIWSAPRRIKLHYLLPTMLSPKTKYSHIISPFYVRFSVSWFPCTHCSYVNSRGTRPSNVFSLRVSGEHPAAIQYGGQLRLQYPVSVFLLSIFVTLIGSWIPAVLTVLPCFFWCRFNVLNNVHKLLQRKMKYSYCGGKKSMSSRTTESSMKTQYHVSIYLFVSLYTLQKISGRYKWICRLYIVSSSLYVITLLITINWNI